MHAPAPDLALTYPGQGAYSPGLLGALEAAHPGVVTPALARLRAAWRDETGEDLDELVRDRSSGVDDLAARSVGLSQLAIFAAGTATQLALAPRLRRDVVHVGHSFGEVAALTAAGAWSLEDGARAVAARVRALEAATLPAGGMVALSGDAAQAVALVRAVGADDLVVAGHNGPGQVVASGSVPSLERLESGAAALGIPAVRLRSPYAFHSPALRPAAEAFERSLRALDRQPLQAPVFSPILGRYYRDDDDLPALVASHLTDPFDFGAAVLSLQAAGVRAYVECGGRSALTSAVRRTLGGTPSGEGETWWALACDSGARGSLSEVLRRLDPAPAQHANGPAPDGEAELVRRVRELLRADVEAITRQVLRERAAELPAGPQPSSYDTGGTPSPAPRLHLATAPVAEAGTPTPTPSAGPAREEVLAGLVELYATALEYPPEVLEEGVELEGDLGVDSVKQTELLARAAERFSLDARPGDLVIGEYPTLGHIADLVLRAA